MQYWNDSNIYGCSAPIKQGALARTWKSAWMMLIIRHGAVVYMNCKCLAFLAKGFSHSGAIFTYVTQRLQFLFPPTASLRVLRLARRHWVLPCADLFLTQLCWSCDVLLLLARSSLPHVRYWSSSHRLTSAKDVRGFIIWLLPSLTLMAHKGSPPSILPM